MSRSPAAVHFQQRSVQVRIGKQEKRGASNFVRANHFFAAQKFFVFRAFFCRNIFGLDEARKNRRRGNSAFCEFQREGFCEACDSGFCGGVSGIGFKSVDLICASSAEKQNPPEAAPFHKTRRVASQNSWQSQIQFCRPKPFLRGSLRDFFLQKRAVANAKDFGFFQRGF